MKYLLLVVCACIGGWAQQEPIRVSDGAGGVIEVSAIGEDDFVLESLDEGATWRRIAIPGSGDLSYFSTSGDGAIFYAARSNDPRPHLRSTDCGQTWENLDTFERQFRIEVNPRDPSQLFAFYNQGIQESIDGGKTWRRIEGDLPWTRIGLSMGPWIDLLLPGGDSPLGPVVRTWAGFFARADVRQWKLLPGTGGLAKPAAFAILPGDRFLAQFGEELWLYDNYLEEPIRIPSPQYFTRFAADPVLSGRVYALAGTAQFVSDDYGRNWAPAPDSVPELTTWIAGKPVNRLTRNGVKWLAQGPESMDLRIARADASGKYFFDWVYPLRGVQRPVRPIVAANGEIYVAGRSSDATPIDFIWRLNASGEYLSGYQFEPRGNFQEVRLEPNGDVVLAGPDTTIRFDRELSRMLP
jgi:hypothetical protein